MNGNSNLEKMKILWANRRFQGLFWAISFFLRWLLWGEESSDAYYKRKINEQAAQAGFETDARLFERWKERWQDESTAFFHLYRYNYQYLQYAILKNKRKHFLWKAAFAVIGFLEYASLLVFFIWNYLAGEENLIALAENGLFFLLILMFNLSTKPITNWINVRQYKETWVRHSNQFHMIKREMLLFLEEEREYRGINFQDQKRMFVLNTMKIWDANQGRFSANMSEEKETQKADQKQGGDIIQEFVDLLKKNSRRDSR